MNSLPLSRRFREDTAALWSAVLDHPFVRGIGAGDLTRDRFEFYLKQDYIYLIEFGRVLALASAKAFLVDLLVDSPVPSRDVKRQARDAGCAWRTVRRAADALGVIRSKTGAPGEVGQRWVWALSEGGSQKHGQTGQLRERGLSERMEVIDNNKVSGLPRRWPKRWTISKGL